MLFLFNYFMHQSVGQDFTTGMCSKPAGAAPAEGGDEDYSNPMVQP